MLSSWKSRHRLCGATLCFLLLSPLTMLSRVTSAFPVRLISSHLGARSCYPLHCATYSIREHSEIAIYRGADADTIVSLSLLAELRPQLEVIHGNLLQTKPLDNDSKDLDQIVWSTHRNNLQLDCTFLEPQFLGKERQSNQVTTQKWDEVLTQRTRLLDGYSSKEKLTSPKISLGDGGDLQMELDVAIAAVHRASFMSRSLQKNLLKGDGILSKEDKSPVTIADFAVQALVIYYLSECFPSDLFIAEESSELLRENKDIRAGVLGALRAASDIQWTDELLFKIVDKGTFDGTADRVWILDPVDGTKGFMRGEHYCIALALLKEGQPVLSVMGCPNLHLDNVLQPSIAAPGARNTADPASISYIEPSVQYPSAASTAGQERRVFSPSTGSLHFAVSGRGAFARSLSQPLGAAFEVQVSSVKEGRDSKLCESAEASHGDRSTTIRVSSALRLKADFIHLDGQCKYCVVGAGSAEGNMRLPPLGYIEKIWDHAPGGHYIMEAGGDMTDLNGQRLDFSLGRLLAASVTGIVASNGVVHKIILDAISGARREEAKLVEAGSQSSRPLGMN